MSSLRLLGAWTRTHNRIFWRTPIGAFFTLVFPPLMLVLFAALFGNDTYDTGRGLITVSQFYVVGLGVYSAVAATYVHLAINMATRRELGILKRVRSTPLPRWVYLGSAVLSSMWIAAISTALMIALGVVAYGVTIDIAKAPALILAFAGGTACFAVLGLALASVARSVSAAVPMAQASLLPLAFLSDVFIPINDDSAWWLVLGDLFPLKHFVGAMSEALDPFSDAPAVAWEHHGVMLLWLAVGAIVAARRFRWDIADPSSHGTGRSRRRSRAVAQS